jgi:hypothetical protein
VKFMGVIPSASRHRARDRDGCHEYGYSHSIARRTQSSSQSIRSLGEGATLWVAPELADRVGAVEVGKHPDVEELGTWRRAVSFWSLLRPAL